MYKYTLDIKTIQHIEFILIGFSSIIYLLSKHLFSYVVNL